MPLLIIPLLIIGGLLLALLMLPFSLRQRYRMGIARRRAIPWVVRLNAWGWLLSAVGLVTAALVASRWASDAVLWASGGLFIGGVLGLWGLRLAHVDYTARGLFHTPNRWLVLFITGVLAARIGLSLWRLWQQARLDGPLMARLTTLMHEHVGTLAAGGLLIGYYLVYEWGLKRRLKYLSARQS